MNEEKTTLYDCQNCLFKLIGSQYIGDEEFEVIRNSSVQLKFAKGETIFKQGGKSTHLAFLHKGIVKFNNQNEDGKNFIMTVVSGPKLVGGANLFFRDTNLFSLVAVEDCEICLIDNIVFREALLKHPNYLMILCERSVEMFQASIFNFISLAHKQVNGRIADILMYLYDNIYKNSGYEFTLSRKEIAEFAASE